MAGSEIKTGFLQKAGKHTFQAWRKRWFVLDSDYLKYYNPGSSYDDSNLLGTIQMVEIQSVQPSKLKKHSFMINTRGRTYHVSSSSDMARDDWIVAIRNSTTNQRRLNVDDTPIYSQLGNEGIYALIQHVDPQNSNPTAPEKPNEYEFIGGHNKNNNNNDKDISSKTRPHSVVPLKSEQSFEIKPRAQSALFPPESEEYEYLPRSMTSADDPRTTQMESIYKKIDQTLSDIYQTDDEDDAEEVKAEETEEENDSLVVVETSQPQQNDDGAKKYAFDEIKKIILQSGDSLDEEIDLTTLASACNLTLDNESRFPAMSLLSSYVNS